MASFTLDSTLKTLLVAHALSHHLYNNEVPPADYTDEVTYKKFEEAVSILVADADYTEAAKELMADFVKTVVEWGEIAKLERE